MHTESYCHFVLIHRCREFITQYVGPCVILPNVVGTILCFVRQRTFCVSTLWTTSVMTEVCKSGRRTFAYAYLMASSDCTWVFFLVKWSCCAGFWCRRSGVPIDPFLAKDSESPVTAILALLKYKLRNSAEVLRIWDVPTLFKAFRRSTFVLAGPRLWNTVPHFLFAGKLACIAAALGTVSAQH